MSNINTQKFGLNSIFDKLREKYNEVDINGKRSLSQDILYDYSQEIIVKKKYTKRKITLKRPKNSISNEKKKRAKSLSKTKIPKIKYLTTKKKAKKKLNNNLIYNKHIFSANNKILKYENNNIRIVNNFNYLSNYNKGMFHLIKSIKKGFFNKIKNILNILAINNNLEGPKIKNYLYSLSYDKNEKENKNLEENNNHNKNKKNNNSSNYIKRKSSSKRNSFEEENIKIINNMDVKQLNSPEEEENNNKRITYVKNKQFENYNKDINDNINYLKCNKIDFKEKKKDDDIGFLDTLKKIKKKVNKIQSSNKKSYENNENSINNNTKTNFNSFNKHASKISKNHIMPKIYYKNKNNNSFNNLNRNKKTVFLTGEKLRNKNYVNNFLIKENQPINYLYSQNKKNLPNKEVTNNINITNNNIIKNDNNYNIKTNSEKKNNKTIFDHVKINNKQLIRRDDVYNRKNIINLINPIKDSNYNFHFDNIKYFNPDKNIEQTVKIFQVKNEFNKINYYFENTINKEKNKMYINGGDLPNKDKIKFPLNENEIIINNDNSNNSNPININNYKKEQILFDSTNYNSYYNNNYNNNPLNSFDDNVNKEQNDKENIKIETLSEDNNCKDKKINNSYEILNPLNLEQNSNNTIDNEDFNIKINSKNEINSLGNEDEFIKNNINNTKFEYKENNQKKYLYNKNIIEKSGDFFYSVKESSDNLNLNSLNLDNNNKIINKKNNMSLSLSSLDAKENEESINDENFELFISDNYLKYKIIDKEKNIINFLSNKYGEKDKNIKKVKIRLSSYLKIIQRIAETKIVCENEQDIIKTKENENKNVKPISIRYYQNVINKLIYEMNENNNIKINNDNIDKISNNNIILYIQKFDSKINSFKNYILYLLVKKHYLKSISQKEKLMNDKTKEIEKHKNEIYQCYYNLKNVIGSLDDTKNNNKKKKECIMMIIDILKHYKYINHKDVKLAKKLFNERKIKKLIYHNNIRKVNINIDKINSVNRNETFDHKKTKLFVSLSYVILPLVYIISYLNNYQKDYSLIE